MLITKTNSTSIGLRRRTIDQPINLGPTSIRVVTIIIIAAAALFYIAQKARSATDNYKIQNLKKTRQELLIKKESLELEAIRLNSLKEAEGKIKELNLEPIRQTE